MLCPAGHNLRGVDIAGRPVGAEWKEWATKFFKAIETNIAFYTAHAARYKHRYHYRVPYRGSSMKKGAPAELLRCVPLNQHLQTMTVSHFAPMEPCTTRYGTWRAASHPGGAAVAVWWGRLTLPSSVWRSCLTLLSDAPV